MNRLFRVAVMVTVALGVLVPVAPAAALADQIGGVIVIPGTGTDLDPIRLRTSAGCPVQANAYYAKMRGHDFPPDGQIITAITKAGLSHTIGFDVYVALIMRDYANKSRTTLTGRYDITVYCINRLTLESYGEFTGSLEFTSPTTYEAIGAAKPVGPPPPPRERAADGSAVDPDAASFPTGVRDAWGEGNGPAGTLTCCPGAEGRCAPGPVTGRTACLPAQRRDRPGRSVADPDRRGARHRGSRRGDGEADPEASLIVITRKRPANSEANPGEPHSAGTCLNSATIARFGFPTTRTAVLPPSIPPNGASFL
jgi:hypothetical protein